MDDLDICMDDLNICPVCVPIESVYEGMKLIGISDSLLFEVTKGKIYEITRITPMSIYVQCDDDMECGYGWDKRTICGQARNVWYYPIDMIEDEAMKFLITLSM